MDYRAVKNHKVMQTNDLQARKNQADQCEDHASSA